MVFAGNSVKAGDAAAGPAPPGGPGGLGAAGSADGNPNGVAGDNGDPGPALGVNGFQLAPNGGKITISVKVLR